MLCIFDVCDISSLYCEKKLSIPCNFLDQGRFLVDLQFLETGQSGVVSSATTRACFALFIGKASINVRIPVELLEAFDR